MHDHDFDLITAVGEGTLSPADERAAITEIEGCARCTADLTSQRIALAALRTAENPALSAEESTRLRASVAGAIGLPAPSTAAAANDRRRRIPWPAISIAAVSLAAIIAVVPVMGMLTTSDDADSTAMALETSTTIEASTPSSDLEFSADDATSQDAAAPPAVGGLPAESGVADGSEGGADAEAAIEEPMLTERVAGTITIEDLQVLIAEGSLVATLDEADDLACADAAADLFGEKTLQAEGRIEVEGIDGTVFVILTDDGTIERAVVLSIEDCTALYFSP